MGIPVIPTDISGQVPEFPPAPASRAYARGSADERFAMPLTRQKSCNATLCINKKGAGGYRCAGTTMADRRRVQTDR